MMVSLVKEIADFIDKLVLIDWTLRIKHFENSV